MTENTCPVCGHNHSKAYCLALAPDQYSRYFCGCDGERFHSVDCEIWELQDAIESWCERTTEYPDNWRLVASPRGWDVQRAGSVLFADEVPVLIGQADDFGEVDETNRYELADALLNEEGAGWPCLKQAARLPELLAGITPLHWWPDEGQGLTVLDKWTPGDDSIASLIHLLEHYRPTAMLSGTDDLGVPAPYITFFIPATAQENKNDREHLLSL